ncbi:helix-turn-helix domain-containing protein [Oceanibaculum pacificum]|uniref:DNA-binding protein n=1 Tax=Oceanibaculum pacificum TaxID=580166 RepID=A0A154VZX0_9PROT|nr:helix-turn-helix domain-containing protein [Oceanibaculum pacificum]KZD06769.1 DNA-binding protein [Oceanibaculum pacificum]
MSKAGQRLLSSARQALAYAEGGNAEGFAVHVPESVDIPALRRREGLSQEQFARRYGFALSALRDWEQGRRQPDRAARLLLRVIEREPEAVQRALHAA